ncbi:MAG TPA: archease [Actinomycetota bacterium]|nr:archease [Actinomycetota bacterium]
MTAPAGFELLEHTADIGIRAWGPDTSGALTQATLALAELMGIRVSGPGTRRRIRVTARDLPGLLVALLDELLWIHESEGAGFVALDVIGLSERNLVAELETAPAPAEPAGIGVKAATYHQLAVEPRADGGVEARVFLDV